MPIDYEFTDRDSIRIECAGEWIEVGLPKPPKPPADQGVSTSPKDPPKDKGKVFKEPEPTIDPGVMSIIGGKDGPLKNDNLFALRSDELTLDPRRFPKLDYFAISDPQDVRKLFDRPQPWVTVRPSGVRVLEVAANPAKEVATASLAKLKELMNDPTVKFDAIRLWRDPGST